MTVELAIDDSALAPRTDLENGGHEVAPDIAYLRTGIVNVVFLGNPSALHEGWVLVDAGLVGSADQIDAVAQRRFGARPGAIVLTHGHFDHVGALLELSERWDVRIYAHRDEAPYLTGEASYPPPDTRADGGIVAKLAASFPRRPVDVSHRLIPLAEAGIVQPLRDWEWIHTPGHTPGHISLWRQDDRTLIAGDAVITTGQESAYEVALQQPEMHGPPRYFTPDWVSAAMSTRRLAELDPELLVTGHGRPLSGEAMRGALRHLAADFERIAPPRYMREAANE